MKKGFTLVELAMVLIVVGLLMGGGFQMMKVMGGKARSTEAKQTLEAAKEAVLAFAINNNRLPTQADFALMNLVGAGNTPIFYNFDNPLSLALQGPCGIQITPLNTTDSNGVNTPNVAFVLAVAGENMNVQTGRIGNNIRFHPWNTLNIDDLPAPINRQEPYDDFHVQVTLAELQSTIGCQPPTIINPTLSVGQVATNYTARFVAKGGNGTYAYTLAGALPPGAPAFTFINGVLTGTPTVAGNYPLTISVASNGIVVPQQYVLVINP